MLGAAMPMTFPSMFDVAPDVRVHSRPRYARSMDESQQQEEKATAREEPTDALIRRGRSGELGAFDELFTRYQPMVRAYVASHFAVFAKQTGLDDLVQDALLRAFKGLHSYDREGRFRAWLAEVVRNEVLDKMRQAKRRPQSVAGDTSALRQRESETTPSQHAMAAETEARLAHHLEGFDDETRSIVLLHAVCKVPHADIGAQLGLTVEAVRKRYSRAIAKIGLRR